MKVDIGNNSLNLSINSAPVEVTTNETNTELDITLENNNLDSEVNNSSVEFKIEMQTVYEKNHANLENLDYENSGHTGFQPAGDYAKKTDIPNVSNFITKDVSNLTNYYNKDEIDEMIGDIETLLGGI